MSPWSAARPVAGYASLAEARMAARLDLLLAAGRIAGWRYAGRDSAARRPLWGGRNGGLVVVGHYRPDFLVALPDGRELWIEVKGRVSRDWPLRRRLIAACYPAIRLEVVRSDQVDTWLP